MWPAYLISRFFFRLSEFLRHWYIDGSKFLAHGFISFLSAADRIFALRVTAHYFWKPLYGDYSRVGRIIGPIFRLGRIAIALGIYLVCAAAFLVIYAAWVVLPILPLLAAYSQLSQGT